jgi:hypothetical protein
MRDVRFRPSPALVVAMVAVVLSLGAAAYATIPDSGGVIHGCYQTNGGLLAPPQGTVRVVDGAQGQGCRAGETALDWNQTGPQGPAGPAGPTGPGSRPSLFTAPGDSTYTAPPGTTSLYVRLWGGGGGGAAGDELVGGGGGGQGGYVEARIPVSAGSAYRVRVGAGGPRGASSGVSGTAGDRSAIDLGSSILATAAGGAAGHATAAVGSLRDPGACPLGGTGGSGSVAAAAQGLVLVRGESGAHASGTGCNGSSGATDGAGGGATGFLGAGGAGGDPGNAPGVRGSDGGVIVVAEPARRAVVASGPRRTTARAHRILPRGAHPMP